jgi:hypothetical protein
MKGKYIPFLILPFFLFLLLLSPFSVGAVEEANGEIEESKKILLCHAKPPATAKNGFNLLELPVQSLFKKGHDIHYMDIIPYFEYTVKEKVLAYVYKEKKKDGECPNNFEEYGDLLLCRREKEVKQEVEKEYLGSRLWQLEAGKIVLANRCEIPALCEYTMDPHDYTEWSEWNKPSDVITEWFRTRKALSFDLIQKQIFEKEEVCEEDEKYFACDDTDSKVVKSEWKVDPLDSTKEYQITTTLELDATDESVICSSAEVKGVRDISTKVTEEKPEVLGEQTQTEQVAVVLAETGASDNILVYIVQTVLMLSTLISGTLFVKRYSI